VNGQKIFISRVLQSDLMLLLARTTPVDQAKRRTDGRPGFLIDIRNLKGFEVRPLRMMMNHSTNALFFDNVEIPAESLIGEEGKGFSYILAGMNDESILVASDSLGDARWFIEKAVAYSNQRVIFGRPIGANQGVQFAIARSHISTDAAQLMRDKAAALFDPGPPQGGAPLRRRAAGRGRGQHGEVPRCRSGLGSRQRVHRLPRGLRLRRGIRRRAQVPRVPALQDGPRQQQPRARLRGRACARNAAELLIEIGGSGAAPPMTPHPATLRVLAFDTLRRLCRRSNNS